MNYELAKKLKDAGFPFKHYSHIPHFYDEISSFTKNEETVPRPVLSELVEACGDEFISLGRRKGFATGEWGAHAKDKHGLGATPEEAVANLWLALRRKTPA